MRRASNLVLAIAGVAFAAAMSSSASAQVATEPAKTVKLKGACQVTNQRVLQMALGNKAREAMAAAGYTKVVVAVAVKPEKSTPIDLTAASVQGLSAVKLTAGELPTFTIEGGTANAPLSTTCQAKVTAVIKASGFAKGATKKTAAETKASLFVQGSFR